MKKFNFDEMKDLYSSDPEMFERVRLELLHTKIQSTSQHQQSALYALQKKLDDERLENPKKFLVSCFKQIDVNLRKSASLWDRLSKKLKQG